MNIERPALRYPGGKFRIANWIISHFPEHKNYCEPCGGGCSVLLMKEMTPIETYNDIDSRIVNYFEVIREQPEKLVAKLKLTPWSREELKRALVVSSDRLEDARRVYVLFWQSFSKAGQSWRCFYNYSTRPRVATKDILELDFLYAVASRLQNVQFENRNALDILPKYNNPDTLIYFDPPYLQSERTKKNLYDYEVSEEFHIEAAGILKKSDSNVIISGLKSDLYKDLYESSGWKRFDKENISNAGSVYKESIWLSPQTFSAYADRSGLIPEMIGA